VPTPLDFEEFLNVYFVGKSLAAALECAAACAICPETDLLTCSTCLTCLLDVAIKFSVTGAVNALKSLIGGSSMACTPSHNVTTKASGPGVCCAALSASGVAPAVGVRVAATNSKGQCIVCEIKASTSKKHPGTLVFKRGAASKPGSQVSCPSTSQGCCALTGG